MKIITFISGGFDSSMYLVTGKKNTLIDTGTGSYNEKTIEAIEKALDGGKLHQIVLTHEHIDHVGGVAGIAEATGADVLASEQTASILTKGDMVRSGAILFGRGLKKVADIKVIGEPDTITMGDEEFMVMDTPGHSEGSVCLYCEKIKVLISGDTIFTHGGVGRWDLPGGNLSKLSASIDRLAGLDVDGLYPGHGEPVEEEGDKHVEMGQRYLKMF